MDDMSPLISLRDITFAYHDSSRLFDRFNFSVNPGMRLGLTGENGSGKTTLLHLIMGLEKPASGQIIIFGKERETEKDFQEVRRRIGFLFQNADDQLFSPTVLEDVAFGPLNMGQTPALARKNARQTLSDLNLTGFEDRVTHHLSGGEKRLVSLASVLVMAPEVLLLDEPTAGLDTRTIERLCQILNRLALPCVIVSHDTDFLARTTDQCLRLEKGRIMDPN